MVEIDVGSIVERVERKLKEVRFKVVYFEELNAVLSEGLGCEYRADEKPVYMRETEYQIDYPWEECAYRERVVDTVVCREGDVTVEIDIAMEKITVSDGGAAALLHFSEPKITSIRVFSAAR